MLVSTGRVADRPPHVEARANKRAPANLPKPRLWRIRVRRGEVTGPKPQGGSADRTRHGGRKTLPRLGWKLSAKKAHQLSRTAQQEYSGIKPLRSAAIVRADEVRRSKAGQLAES